MEGTVQFNYLYYIFRIYKHINSSKIMLVYAFDTFAGAVVLGYAVQKLDGQARLLDSRDNKENSEELWEIQKSYVHFGVFTHRLKEVRESLRQDIFKLLKKGNHQFTTLINSLDSVESRLDHIESRLGSLESSVNSNDEEIRSMKASLTASFSRQETFI